MKKAPPITRAGLTAISDGIGTFQAATRRPGESRGRAGSLLPGGKYNEDFFQLSA